MTTETQSTVLQTVYDGTLIEYYSPAYQAENPEHYRTVAACGGIAVKRLTAGLPDYIPAVVTDREHVITVLMDYVKWMNKEEIRAMIDHEVGHIKNKHLHAVDETMILVDADSEMEADAYSAAIHGKKVVASALRNSLVYVEMVLHGKTEAEARATPIAADMHLRRLAALEA